MKSEIGIIVLAAGASSRLGQPKQILQFEGKTLLRRAVDAAIETNFKTVVVLGANFEAIKAEIEDFDILLPSSLVLMNFDILMKNVFNQKDIQNKENQKLGELNSLLLAKMTKVEM